MEIKFEFLQGFKEFPIPKVLAQDLRNNQEIWVDWFGPYIHIDDYELNPCTHGFPKRYSLSARSDEISGYMIELFGNDMLFLDTLNSIKRKLQQLVEHTDKYKGLYVPI